MNFKQNSTSTISLSPVRMFACVRVRVRVRVTLVQLASEVTLD